MADNYCKRCGTPLSSEDKFCSNCGKPLDAAPTITRESYKAPQVATPPVTPSSRLGAAFWLGLVGAIFGLLIGAIYLGVSTLSFVSKSWDFWARAIGVIVFSILGIVGPLRIIETEDKTIAGFKVNSDMINAGLMIIAGIGMLICVYQLGILSALLFFIGAALILLKRG